MKIKKILAIVLIAALAASLAACNKKEEGGGKTSGRNDKTETPEFVYAADFVEIDSPVETGLDYAVFTDEAIYTTTYTKVGERTPREGETEQYEGQFDIYGNRLHKLGYDGSFETLPDYEVLITDSENNVSQSITSLMVDSAGNIITLENLYEYWFDPPEGVTEDDPEYWDYHNYKESTYIRKLGPTGAEISRAELNYSGVNDYFYAYSCKLLGDTLYVVSDMMLCAFGIDGNMLYEVEMEDYPDSIMELNGGLGVLLWADGSYVLKPFDVQSRSFGEPMELPSDAYSARQGGGDYEFYYTSGINFYGFNAADARPVKLFNWLSCDINSDWLGSYTVREDGSIVGLINEWDDKYENCETELVTVSKKPYDSVPHKESITLAAQYVNYEIRDYIIDFNRSHDNVRIEAIDYSEYNTEDDYEAGLTKLTTEIMAGNVPDIIALSGLPAQQMAAKGILADLYTFMDADPELKRDDFFSNILAAYEQDGKLYSTVSGFNIRTVCGASSVVGDTSGWSYAELLAALQKMPAGCDIYNIYTTRSSVLQNALSLDMNSYVNWTTGEVKFGEHFAELLEFAKRFQEEMDENYEYRPEDEESVRIKEGRQMLMEAYISNFSDIYYYEYYFGGNMTFIGYPTMEGSGNMITTSTGYAMSNKCENKDAAWEFLRVFFTEEYQDDTWNFPSNINSYNKMREEAMTIQYEKDGDGNYLLDENGEKIPIVQYSMGWGENDYVESYAVSPEQAAKVDELVKTTAKVQNYDDSIIELVTEQAEAYFSGQKSAEEVAKLVQNMVSTYVNEQR